MVAIQCKVVKQFDFIYLIIFDDGKINDENHNKAISIFFQWFHGSINDLYDENHNNGDLIFFFLYMIQIFF